MEQAVRPEQQAESQWLQWQEQAAELQIEAAFSDEFVSDLKRVWEASDYVAQCCLRDLSLLPALNAGDGLKRAFAPGEMEALLQDRLKDVTTEVGLHQQLRRFRRDQMVRIIWRDLTRSAPLAETLEELSALADTCIDQALNMLYEWALEKYGIPRSESGEQQYLVVLGMGKLGARELNLSSDIDLIFVYPDQGEVEGPRYQSNEQFFMRLCQQLNKALKEKWEEWEGQLKHREQELHYQELHE